MNQPKSLYERAMGAIAKLDELDGRAETEREVERLTTQLAAATTRADDAEKQRDAAVKVLRKVEWNSYDGPGVCKLCKQTKDTGHAPSCALAACLNGGA